MTPLQLATDRAADEEARNREAKDAGRELLEAVMACNAEDLPEAVRVRRQKLLELGERER